VNMNLLRPRSMRSISRRAWGRRRFAHSSISWSSDGAGAIPSAGDSCGGGMQAAHIHPSCEKSMRVAEIGRGSPAIRAGSGRHELTGSNRGWAAAA